MKRILVVDDELRMRRIVTDYLKIKGYEAVEAENGAEALARFREQPPDLVLLDVMMPVMDGWDCCREIRKMSACPVILLTARAQEEDELKGFSLGVDEYIAKPFSLKVLAARLEAVLRRHSEPSAPVAAAGLSVRRESREVRVDGCKIELTYTEFELLDYLTQNAGLALSRDKILDNVWRYEYDGDARTVDTHVKKLRGKLGRYGGCIQTIRGIGYKFDPAGEESL